MPRWLIGGPGNSSVPAWPDYVDEPGVTLIDPRLSRDEVVARATELGYPGLAGAIDIREPALLPDPVEEDALALHCLWLCQRPGDPRYEGHEPGNGVEARELMHAA